MAGINAAIEYVIDGFDTSTPQLMGRRAAGEAFLNAFVDHAGVDHLYCYAPTRKHAAHFGETFARRAPGTPVTWIPYGALDRLGDPGCLYRPDANVSSVAWERRFIGARRYSVCGVTHTTASHAVMDMIGDLLVAPLQSWDALICTSDAVRHTVGRVLGDWADYLEDRIGARPQLSPQLPVIPLGVDCAAFAPTPETERYRTAFRERHSIADDDVAVLFFGRLSYHAKANPLPLYVGLERAAKETGKRLHLVLAGWFANDALEQAFRAGAKALCPSVRLIIVDGREAETRRKVWFAADLFSSFSDNVQETFGLTPLEAMAAGLPVVVSDWNGYRATVRDGVDGLMVPTWMPPPGGGELLALRHLVGIDNYDHYIGLTSQSIAVDVEAATRALITLIADPDLRRRMGDAGRARAWAEFDWAVIIRAYQALWQELAERRAKDAERVERRRGAPAHPLRADPFRAFDSYPTHIINHDTRVAPTAGGDADALRSLLEQSISRVGTSTLLSDDACVALIDALTARGGSGMTELVQAQGPSDPAAVVRTVAWLAKLGLVRLEGPDSDPNG